MLIMIVVPVVEAIAFWLVLRRPTTVSFDPMDAAAASSTDAIVSGGTKEEDVENTHELSEEERPLVGLKNKLKYVPKLFKYMIPLTLVYFLEYLINQGLVSFN